MEDKAMEIPMAERSSDLRVRTKQFALRIIRFCASLPRDQRTGYVIGDQLLRCGTSVGANYRAACRARSPAEFRAKMGIVEEEIDESMYWLELVIESGLMEAALVKDLLAEAGEITAMTVASIRTSRG